MPQDDAVREIETKSFSGFEIKDAATGEVAAIVGKIGEVDKDGDVFLPGSIRQPNRVKLSGYAHDVVKFGAPPAGIGSITQEGDDVVFRGRFFMSTERGRESFLTVKELGEDGQWSYGFPKATIAVGKLTAEMKEAGARRAIAGVDPFEASPVFIGAGWGTRTLSVKSHDPGAPEEAAAEAVCDAIAARNADAEDEWLASDMLDGAVVVRCDTKLFRVPVEVAEGGAVTLGDAVEVEVVYQPVEGKAADQAEAEAKEEEGVDEIAAKAAADARAAELKAAADAEFERFRKTTARLRRSVA